MAFYFNWPWNIDGRDYNCSSRTLEEWLARGSVNEIQGAYFAVSGTFFLVVYFLCMVSMYRAHLLRIPCYKLMFFGAVIDVLELVTGSLSMSYFNFRGAVFCTDVVLQQIGGHITWSSWNGSSMNCVVLAVNRIVEMIPILDRFKFLFRGKTLYLWMLLTTFYMIVRMFFTRASSYNSRMSSYFFAPLITDDIEWEMEHYFPPLLPVRNIAVAAALCAIYLVLCSYVVKQKLNVHSRLDKTQMLLFLQALCICSSSAIASILYVYFNFFETPYYLVAAGNVIWQLSHGIHGLVYIVLNRQVRHMAHSMMVCRMVTSSNTKITQHSVISRKVCAQIEH